MVVERFGVYLINLDPTVEAEMRKKRPCVVISPDEINAHLRTVIIAPLTSNKRSYPMRVDCRVLGKSGQIVLDQMRAIDRSRLRKLMTRLPRHVTHNVISRLTEMFAA